ncbi:MAG: glycosyltransferase family 2 protein [Candidatus Xenobia bacterium]
MPIYNERATLEEVLRRVLASPVGDAVRLEVVLVDDGSSDGSSEMLDRLAAQDNRLAVHHHAKNAGKGAAVRTGLTRANGDVVLIQDADLEYDPVEYPKLLEPILQGRTQVVYGSRFLGPMQGMDPWHVLGNRILTLTSNLLFGQRLTDAYTCYKVFTREVAGRFRLRSTGFEMEAELTAKIQKQGFKIIEVPITFKARGWDEGKKIRKLDGFLGVLNLIKYRFVD